MEKLVPINEKVKLNVEKRGCASIFPKGMILIVSGYNTMKDHNGKDVFIWYTCEDEDGYHCACERQDFSIINKKSRKD